MNNYINQYKSLFHIVWIGSCLIYPSWSLPVPVTSRAAIFFGLMLYFAISACLMSFCFKDLSVDQVNIPGAKDCIKLIKDNWVLAVVCWSAFVLHIYSLTFPISLAYDEPTHLMGGLGLYVYVKQYWHKLSDLPIQYIVWPASIAVLIVANIKKVKDIVSDKFSSIVSKCRTDNKFKYIMAFIIFALLSVYFFAMRNLPYHPNVVRFPPLGKILYLFTYLFAGINKEGPRILQLLFYILTAIYIFRSMKLFRNEYTALLGATIFLFTPLMFFYASRAELALGNIFFIVLIAYHFIKFIKDKNDTDIVLVSLFIGIGFLYKRTVLLMLIVCIAYLILKKLADKDFKLIKYVMVLLFALVPIIPWMVIAKFHVWRAYEIVWSHFISLDIMLSYLSIIPSQASWVILCIFVASVIFALAKRRDPLTLFFGFVFITYYLFFTADVMFKIDRFSLILYPTIAIFAAQFISYSIEQINYKPASNIITSLLTCFLILICTVVNVPGLNPKFVTYWKINSRYFPTESAMKWVRNNVQYGEKILILQVPPTLFYRDKFNIDKNKIVDYWYFLKDASTPEKLKAFYKENDISYIMFSYGPAKDMPHDVAMQNYLVHNMGKEFQVLVDLNTANNHIYIFRPKDI